MAECWMGFGFDGVLTDLHTYFGFDGVLTDLYPYILGIFL